MLAAESSDGQEELAALLLEAAVDEERAPTQRVPEAYRQTYGNIWK